MHSVSETRKRLTTSTAMPVVHLRSSGFNESGGATALSGASHSLDTAFTTLGVRASSDFHLGSLKATMHGGIAWRHAYGDVTPLAQVAFAGGSAFDVKGVPIARNTALLEAGLDMKLTDRAMLGLSYQGQIGSGVQQHGFNGKLAVNF